MASGVITVPVEPLNAAGFAPFGELLVPEAGNADFVGINTLGWKANLDLGGGLPLVMTMRSEPKGLRFSMLERHFAITQTFIPLGESISVVAVAQPTGPDDVPDPQSLRGFVLDGTAGYLLYPGTWHSLDRYPLDGRPADIVIISSQDTQLELESVDRDQWKLTQQVDYLKLFGIEFAISK